MKHTPGPWVINSFSRIEDAKAEDADAWGWADPQWDYKDLGLPSEVWKKSGNGVTGLPGIIATTEANAHLIAAAPELYEALNICLGHLTGGMDGNWADCDPIDVARKALAKAEGK